MADNIKIVGNVNNIQRISRFKTTDTDLLSINNLPQNFGNEGDFIEFFVYDNNNNLLIVNYNYTNFKLPTNKFLFSDGTLPEIQIDPTQDIQNAGYNNGTFKSQYSFFRRKFSSSNTDLFISEISENRTEIRVNSINISSSDLVKEAQNLINELTSVSYQKYYVANFDIDIQQTVINIAIDNTTDIPSILFKLYEPLSAEISEKDTLWVTEEITEPYVFNINLDLSIIPAPLPQLRGPNFDIELDIKQNIATGYQTYSSLVSSLTGSSYHKVLNYMNDNSYDLNIDYTAFENFIHFSSAKKRLEIFYDKTKQIENYNNDILTLINPTSALKNTETASIKLKIDNIVKYFDGFENYLYYESSSYSWPKSGNNKPYNLLSTGSSITKTWYSNYTGSAELYDQDNLDHLYNIIPEYIKNDPNNYQPYYTFIDMIGHYFDNVWIYITSINELYNADNNLEKGVSKDIVYDALKSLGVKLYNSKGNDNFDNYINGLNSGSVLFDNDFSVTSSYLNNISKKDLLAETYKRIYHNLILLNKGKGTSVGLQNLITTFGITGSILSPKEFGGSLKKNEIKGYDNDKITIQNNTITGSVLSPFISLQTQPTASSEFTSTDLHFVDLSFSPQNELNSRISASIASTYPTFSLDEYIGDPRLMESSSYDNLIIQQNYFISASSAISGSAQRLDYKEFIELVKYFDNSLFKMLKDFVPARANALTGVTIKSPILERNKISSYQPDVTEQETYQANYNAPTIKEDNDYHYDKLSGNKSSFYTGEIIGSYIDTYKYFFESNPNPYLYPSRSFSLNKFNHSDFNVMLNNVTGSRTSISRYKTENIYNAINSKVFSTQSAITQYSSSAELQDSNLSLRGYENSRYEGTKIYSLKYNVYSSASEAYIGDSSFGKNAVIDQYTRKIGLFTQIKNNNLLTSIQKNNVILKYLVDEEGSLTELNKKNKNWVEVQNLFKEGQLLTVAQFNPEKYGDSKVADGDKLIYNSGYNYLPILYTTGSTLTDKLHFQYSGEDIAKLFKSTNINGGFISGSGNNVYPLKPSGSQGAKVIYNIFDQIDFNDNLLFKTGSSIVNTFPSYSVSADGTYVFDTSINIGVQFQATNQNLSFKYDIIKGEIIDNFPSGDIIATSGIQKFTTSYKIDIIARGYNVNQGEAVFDELRNPIISVDIPSSYFPLLLDDDIDDLNLSYVSTNIYSDGTNNWRSYIITWNQGGSTRTNLVFSKSSSPNNTFDKDDYITSLSSPNDIKQNLNGTLNLFVNKGDSLRLVKNDKIYFKLSLVDTTTNNFTASFTSPGELKNNLTSNIAGNSVFAIGSSSDSFISRAISSSLGNIDTLVFNEGLSSFNNYLFLPDTGSADLNKLYTDYGRVNTAFTPMKEDVVVVFWNNQSTEFKITRTFNSGSNRCITLDRNLPDSLRSKINNTLDTTTAGVDKFIILRRVPDETNVILTFNKSTDPTSVGFIIPNNIHPDVLSNIDTITKEVKQKLIDAGSTDLGGF
jgi:hypothetical protein